MDNRSHHQIILRGGVVEAREGKKRRQRRPIKEEPIFSWDQCVLLPGKDVWSPVDGVMGVRSHFFPNNPAGTVWDCFCRRKQAVSTFQNRRP